MDRGLGWNHELEAKHAETFPRLFSPICAASAALPDNVDPRGKLSIKDQGQHNSCEGNARAKVAEFCNWIKTGQAIDISAKFDYLTTKMVDGTYDGPDAGASISGGGLASTKFGECLEMLCPYWPEGAQYETAIPQAAIQQAAEHRLRSFSPIRSYEDWINAIGMGLGGILFGVRWTTGLAGCQGVYDNFGGRTLGGHAQAGCGYITRGQEKWPIVVNSHGCGWGDKGTAVMPPKICDWICRQSPYPPVLMSDLPAFRQREFHDMTGVIPTGGILPSFSKKS